MSFLDVKLPERREPPCEVCGGPHGDTCQHISRAKERAKADEPFFAELVEGFFDAITEVVESLWDDD